MRVDEGEDGDPGQNGGDGQEGGAEATPEGMGGNGGAEAM